LAALGAGGFAVGFVIIRRRREAHSARRLERIPEGELPPTLYPVIDPNICIGSLSCLKACPEGDILGVVNGVARLVEPAHCIGHGRCAAECPVGAIKLVFGGAQRGVDLPEINSYFESSRPGVHIIGELGGMGLIRNAVSQGIQCGQHLKRELGRNSRGREQVDVAIVGAGPAGLAAALTCRAEGLSFHVLEQDTVGGSVAHYPRQKVVMAEPVELPIYGRIHKQMVSKEELLATWKDVLTKSRIRVNEGIRVIGLEGEDGAFRVQTPKGHVKASKVILAVGRRGTPRRLNVKGETLPKVSYRLVDARQYEACGVMVVGGGDSAIEAATRLAEESEAEVTLVHRGEAFSPSRQANRGKMQELAAQGRVKLLFNAHLVEIHKDHVVLNVAGRAQRIANDYVIVCAGGELPVAFLGKVGVNMTRMYGTALGEEVEDTEARRGSAQEVDRRKKDTLFAWFLFGLGAAVVLALAWMGWSYYWLPIKARAASPLHAMLRPSGPIGHGIGVGATAFLFTNFLYALRKRWRVLKRSGRIKRWLTWHQFIGYMGPFLIAYHAAFQSKNQLATFTAISLGIVVFTGVIGRFFYGMLPSSNGRTLELSDVMSRWTRLRQRMEPLLSRVKDSGPVRELFDEATQPPKDRSLLGFLVHMPTWRLRTQRRLHAMRRLFPDDASYQEMRDALDRVRGLRASVSFYKSVRRFFSSWRILHVVLAVFLALMIVAHIAVEIYFGYTWIFA
jgi:thioredoxin reductase/Pyruvate/2-oxoacid:ferredoxin oxidoreductase delta subunit